MPLTEVAIRAAKPAEKPRKLYDERGLYLLIEPSGSRGWRLKYHFAGREKLISLGSYPDTGLKRAREKRDEARRQLADKIDPSMKRKAERAAQTNTFEAVGREWLAMHQKSVALVTFEKKRQRFEDLVFPHIGKQPIADIDAHALLDVFKRIEAQGKHETAHRVRSECGNVFRYAIVTRRASRDPTADLRGALAPVVVKNRAAIIVPSQIGALLRSIDGYVGQPATMAALKLAPLVFVRPGELRAAEWTEFDLDEAEWRIGAERMKMGERHIVPLATQAVAILRDLELLTGGGHFVFPSLRTPARPISENTINAALRSIGYAGDQMTGHGFRAMASTLLNEQGFPPDVIELQLAHAERNEVRSAYNRAERLAERRAMMQAWANYLDALKAGETNVVNINGREKAAKPAKSRAAKA